MSSSSSDVSETSATESMTQQNLDMDKTIKYRKWKKAVAYLRLHHQRREFARELPIYLLFLSALCAVIFIGWDITNSYNTVTALNGIILEGEFPASSTQIEKNWYGIGDFNDFWDFMEGPFFDGVGVTQDPAGNNLPRSDLRYVGVWNKIVGPIRIRQKRVIPEQCRLLSFNNTNYNNLCYPEYDNDIQSKVTFGSANQFSYSGEAETKTYKWNGVVSGINYDEGGFVVDLPLDLTAAKAAVAALKAGSFLDLQTRAVFININFVNPSLELYTSMQFLIEFLPSGHVFVNDVKIRPFRVDLFLRPSYTFRTLCEGLMCIFILYYTYKYISNLIDDIVLYPNNKLAGLKAHFWNLWNILDIINLSIFIAVIVLRLLWYADPQRLSLAANTPLMSDKYTNFEILARNIYAWNHLLSLNVLLAFLKSFKFLQISGKLSLMWAVIIKAAPDLAAFLVLFFIIFLGFVTTGYILFGPELEAFRTYEMSFNSLALMTFGAFEYSDMHRVDQYYAPIYFYLFMILVFFILINMFLAIINDAYVIVAAQVDTEAESLAIKNAAKAVVSHFKRLFSKGIPKDRQALRNYMKGFRKGGISDKTLFRRISASPLFAEKEREGKTATITLRECQEQFGKGVQEDRAAQIWATYKASRKAEAEDDGDDQSAKSRDRLGRQFVLIKEEFASTKKDLAVLKNNLETLYDNVQ